MDKNFRAFKYMIIAQSDYGKSYMVNEIIEEYVPKHIKA